MPSASSRRTATATCLRAATCRTACGGMVPQGNATCAATMQCDATCSNNNATCMCRCAQAMAPSHELRCFVQWRASSTATINRGVSSSSASTKRKVVHRANPMMRVLLIVAVACSSHPQPVNPMPNAEPTPIITTAAAAKLQLGNVVEVQGIARNAKDLGGDRQRRSDRRSHRVRPLASATC